MLKNSYFLKPLYIWNIVFYYLTYICDYALFGSFLVIVGYLFIIINRIKKIKLAFSQELKLQKDEWSDLKYTKYKLAGVIIKEENNNYSCVLKQNEYENERGTIIEEWKKFYDENAISIKFDKESSASINQIFDPLNAEILIYKGI